MANKVIVFDLDNTLVITRPAAKKAYKHAINHLAKAVNRYNDKYKLYNHWKKIVQKVMGEKKPHMRSLKYSLGILMEEQNIPSHHLPPALNAFEKELLDNLEPQKGAKDLLDWLNGTDICTVAVSTGSARSEAVKKLKKAELYPFIKVLVTSNETKTMKPDPLYFKLIMEETGVNPGGALVIGDSQEEDIDPAKKLGLETILLPPNQFHLSSLKDQIAEFLEK